MVTWIVFAKVGFVLMLVVGILAPLLAWAEHRYGVTTHGRLAPEGLQPPGGRLLSALRPLASFLALFASEDATPARTHRAGQPLAAAVAAVCALAVFAVVPYGGHYDFGLARVSFVVADIDWGLLYVVALVCLGSFGTLFVSARGGDDAIAGVRCAVRTLALAVTLGVALAGTAMVFGSLSLGAIARAQDELLVRAWGPLGIPRWGLFVQPLGFVAFFACLLGVTGSSGVKELSSSIVYPRFWQAPRFTSRNRNDSASKT